MCSLYYIAFPNNIVAGIKQADYTHTDFTIILYYSTVVWVLAVQKLRYNNRQIKTAPINSVRSRG